MKDVLNSLHPPVILRSFCAFSNGPRVILRVTSTTRFFFVCLITVAIHKSGHTSKHALPLPAVFFTFSRNARIMLFGYAFHPSVQTKRACMDWQQARTCWSKLS